MDIRDFLGYRLVCVMSKGLKDEVEYTDKEFEVIFRENENGYLAIVSGTNDDGEAFSQEWDAEDVVLKFAFDTWDIKKRIKL